MPDDTLPENPPPATTPTAAPAQQPAASGAPAITPEVQAVIDARIREAVEHARNATWKQARETLGKKTGSTASNDTPPAQTATPSQPTAQPAASGLTVHDVMRVTAFSALTAEYGVPAKGAALLLDRLMVEKPEDTRAWATAEFESFGWKKPTPSTSTTTTAPQTAATVHPGAPVTGNGAPASPTTITADTPIMSMSVADRQALTRQIGNVAFADRLMKEMSGRSVPVR